MKQSTALLLLLAATAFGQNNSCSGGIRLRYEFRDLGQKGMDRYFQALQQMHKDGQFEKFADIHVANKDAWHFSAFFLPVHRYWLLKFEDKLREYDKDITLPYFDWSMDAGNPSGSEIWKYFDRSNGQCVGKSHLNGNSRVTFKGGECLSRKLNENQPSSGTFVDAPTLGSGMTISKFWDFAKFIEGSPHYLVHEAIGGQMSTMRSPLDPFFVFHHGFLDKLWNDWQRFKDDERLKLFDGETKWGSKDDASPDSTIPGYNGVRVKDILDSERNCVRYMQPRSDFIGYSATPGQKINRTSNLPNTNTTTPISITNQTNTLSDDFKKSMGIPSDFVNASRSEFDKAFDDSRNRIQNKSGVLIPGNNVPVKVAIRTSKGANSAASSIQSQIYTGLAAFVMLFML